MRVEAYTVCNPITGLCKQRAIWATEGGRMSPLVYLQRPKWITNDDDWDKITSAIRLELPKNTEIGN